ncbi:MAG: response regulator, partial [Desulfobacteraceae bacterium]
GIPIPAEESLTERKRILIVDDDAIIVETIVQALEEEEYDYDIISASDGFEAGIQVNHFKPHLLILDIMMPDIKGYDVCKKIKSHDETKDTKIIVLSAYLDDEKFKKMKEYGADLCFSKPLPLPKLKQEVAQLLGLA